MTRSVVTDLAGRKFVLRLPLAALFAIDEECGKSAWAVLHDIVTGQARIEQLDAVLHHGLIGGGMMLVETAAVMDRVRQSNQPLQHYLGVALQALLAALDVPETARENDDRGAPFNRVSAYRTGMAMGMRPTDVDAMMLRDFLAAAEAFTTAGGGMSEAEKDELWEWIKGGNDER